MRHIQGLAFAYMPSWGWDEGIRIIPGRGLTGCLWEIRHLWGEDVRESGNR